MPNQKLVQEAVDEQWKTAELAAEKANVHMKAAELISASGNYTMAFSHIVLGFEEWLIYLTSVENAWKVLQLGVGYLESKRYNAKLYDHSFKQLASILSIEADVIFGNRVKLVFQRKAERKRVTHKELRGELIKGLGTTHQLLSKIDLLESMKQAGFYSRQVDRKGNKLTPADSIDYEIFHEFLERYLRYAAENLAVKPTRDELKINVDFMREYLKYDKWWISPEEWTEQGKQKKDSPPASQLSLTDFSN